YTRGESLRSITQALVRERVPTARGGTWRHATVGKLLASPFYVGRLAATDENGEHLPGKHPKIIEPELWDRAQAIKAVNGGLKAGRRPAGRHLLVKGLLRCPCGAAMRPERAHPGD